MGGRYVQKPYAFLPSLSEAAELPLFRQNYPALAQIWSDDVAESDARTSPDARLKLVELAEQQGLPSSMPSLSPADLPEGFLEHGFEDQGSHEQMREEATGSQHQAALRAERETFAAERHALRTQLLGEELAIETRKLRDELRRMRRMRPVRSNAQKVLWWTEDDVNHIISGKQLLLRRASNAASKTEAMCSFAMGTCRDWLFRSRQRMESKSLVRGKTVAFGAQALEKSESKLKERFAKAAESVSQFQSQAQLMARRLMPDQKQLRLAAQPEKVHRGLEIEKMQAKGARDAVTERIKAAEAKLDELAEEDVAADFLTRWSEQINEVSIQGMQSQRKTKELADRIEDALRKEATKYRQVAQVAYADVAAERAAEAAQQRAEEARCRREAREAARQKELQQAVQREQEKQLREQEKMVPVKLKMSGLRSAAIEDKAKFGQFAEQKLAKALDLSQSQVRVTGIK